MRRSLLILFFSRLTPPAPSAGSLCSNPFPEHAPALPCPPCVKDSQEFINSRPQQPSLGVKEEVFRDKSIKTGITVRHSSCSNEREENVWKGMEKPHSHLQDSQDFSPSLQQQHALTPELQTHQPMENPKPAQTPGQETREATTFSGIWEWRRNCPTQCQCAARNGVKNNPQSLSRCRQLHNSTPSLCQQSPRAASRPLHDLAKITAKLAGGKKM